MSVQVMQAAFQNAGLPKALSIRMVEVMLLAIEKSLEQEGKFVLRGIGRIEVVRNQDRNTRTLLGGKAIRLLPVRVRFEASKMLKAKMAKAYVSELEK